MGQAMMTSLNGNIFRITGPLCGEFTGPKSPLYFPIVFSSFYYSTSNYYTANEFVNSILHYCYVLMTAMASQITCVSSVYSIVCSGADKTGLCVGNSPVTDEFPTQKASNAELRCFHLMTSSWYNHNKTKHNKTVSILWGCAVCHVEYGKWRLLPHRWCLSEIDQWPFSLTRINFNPSMDK